MTRSLPARLRRAGVGEASLALLAAREGAEGAPMVAEPAIVAPGPRQRPARPARGQPSATELAYGAHLAALLAAGRVLGYAHEAVTFELGGDGPHRQRYTPDYLVWTGGGRPELHEVKAARKDAPPKARRRWRAEEDALAKLRAMPRLYPLFPLVVVWPDRAAPDGWGRDWITRPQTGATP
jgi:hypothetical protein